MKNKVEHKRYKELDKQRGSLELTIDDRELDDARQRSED